MRLSPSGVAVPSEPAGDDSLLFSSGNLWEEMKDDSFNLEALGTFSNSPLRLSDCDLGTGGLPPGSSGGALPFSDLQVTGLYASYSSLESLSSQYMGMPGNSKPIALL